MQPCRQDLGVVDDEDVAGQQELGQIAHAAVLDRARGVEGDEQTGGVARLARHLGDGVVGEVVVEAVDARA